VYKGCAPLRYFYKLQLLIKKKKNYLQEMGLK